MPRAGRKKKNEIEPDGIYTAWQGGSALIDGIDYSVTSGERRRGDDPMVQHHSWLFVADGVPESERPTLSTRSSSATTRNRRPPSTT